MVSVKIKKFGPPTSSIFFDETSINANLGKDELLLDVLLFPINPADLLLIEGKYAAKPKLPINIGSECVAVVSKVGSEINTVSEGDIVLPLTRGNWATKKIVKVDEIIKLKDNTKLEQVSMLKVNPATAYLILNNYVNINKNDYVMQNAANSSVGNHIIQLCKYYGIKNINLVRRNEVIQDLYDKGATKVFNNDDLNQIYDFVRERNIKIYLDALGGKQVNKLVSAMNYKTTIINYGLLSGKNIELDPYNVIFKDVQLRGFWLSIWLEKMSYHERNNLYNHLEDLIQKNIIFAEIEKVYEMSALFDAIKHSSSYSRKGKILVSPNLKLLNKILSQKRIIKLNS